MKNALIAAGLTLAGFVMVPSAASAMCVGAGNICANTMGNSGYQQYQPYGQQYANNSYKQPKAMTFPVYNTTFPSYMPGSQYGSQYQSYGQQYPYAYGYQNAAYYYPQAQYGYNTYNYSYEDYYEEEYYGYGNSAGCGYSQSGAYYCY